MGRFWLPILEVHGNETLRVREGRPSDPLPTQSEIWLLATLERTYADEHLVSASAWVAWNYWILYGLDAVKAELRDRVRKERRRFLRGSRTAATPKASRIWR